MYGLLTKCEVKITEYWPSSFFACLWTETKSTSISSQKRTRPISSHLDRTNLVNKGFIIWLLGKFFLRDTAGSPERARWLHLARSGSQSHRTIWVILPARGASHIIRENLHRGSKYRPNAMNLYTRPRPRFSHTDRLSSVNKMFLIWQKQEQFNLFDAAGLY